MKNTEKEVLQRELEIDIGRVSMIFHGCGESYA